MALNSTTIKSSLIAKLNGLSFDENSTDAEAKEEYAQAITDWLIETITSASVTVPATGLVSASPGSPVTGIATTGSLS